MGSESSSEWVLENTMSQLRCADKEEKYLFSPLCPPAKLCSDTASPRPVTSSFVLLAQSAAVMWMIVSAGVLDDAASDLSKTMGRVGGIERGARNLKEGYYYYRSKWAYFGRHFEDEEIKVV